MELERIPASSSFISLFPPSSPPPPPPPPAHPPVTHTHCFHLTRLLLLPPSSSYPQYLLHLLNFFLWQVPASPEHGQFACSCRNCKCTANSCSCSGSTIVKHIPG